ncbi:MAG: ChrR family anti-sigma-E factor [Alphaproteobacteria bacterium]|nr:ChrR family anti-sigma-E factor [Alphaproteobacteria bacterium]
MSVSHHLDDATLLSHAAGTLPRTLALVVDAHLEMCPHCRAALKAANAIGGALLSDLSPAPVSSSLKDAVMGRIGSATIHRLPRAQAARQGGVPLALQRVLRLDSLDDIPWRKSAPGVHIHKLPKEAGEAGFFGLLKIAPGAAMPEHGHGGSELTLILQGAYHDELGHFGEGDIADHDESVDHTPVAEGEQPCICLVATQAPTRFRSWPARVMQKFIGI